MKKTHRFLLLLLPSVGLALALAAAPHADDASPPASAAPTLQLLAQAEGATATVTAKAALTDASGADLATLEVGAPVQRGQSGGDGGNVTVEGWSMESSPSAIFLNDAQRIPLASLSEAGIAAREVVESKTDDYGTAWQKVRLTGHVDGALLTEHPDDDLWTGAADLYAATCAACHALHPTTDFTATQWPGAIQGMLQYVTLTDAELDLVTKYVQYHASDMP